MAIWAVAIGASYFAFYLAVFGIILAIWIADAIAIGLQVLYGGLIRDRLRVLSSTIKGTIQDLFWGGISLIVDFIATPAFGVIGDAFAAWRIWKRNVKHAGYFVAVIGVVDQLDFFIGLIGPQAVFTDLTAVHPIARFIALNGRLIFKDSKMFNGTLIIEEYEKIKSVEGEVLSLASGLRGSEQEVDISNIHSMGLHSLESMRETVKKSLEEKLEEPPPEEQAA